MRYYKNQMHIFKKTYSKSVLPVFLCLFFFINKIAGQVYPSKTEKTLSVSANVFICRSSLTDRKFSQLIFSGYNPGAAIVIKYSKEKVEHQIITRYSTGKLTADISPQASLTQGIFHADYSNLYTLNQVSNDLLKYKLGGTVQFMHVNRLFDGLINSNTSFETAISLGGVFQIEYTSDKTGFTVLSRLSVPLIFSYSQPAFSGNNASGLDQDNKSGFSSFFKNNQFALVPDYLRINTSLQVGKYFNNSNLIAIVYDWDYYKTTPVREVLQANHRLGIAYTYKL